MSDEIGSVPPTQLGWGDPAYTVRVERLDYAGKTTFFEFNGYAVLSELLNDIEREADKRGWFEDERNGVPVP